jgi:hypothetical protein
MPPRSDIAMKFSRAVLGVGLMLVLASSASAADKAPITYDEHIRPIFRQHCFKCHGEDEQKADLNLSLFAAVVKGGSTGQVLVPGRPSGSMLFEAITQDDPAARMPPNSPPLAAEKIELIRLWIEQGLRESAGSRSMAAARDLSFRPAADVASRPAGPPPMPGQIAAVEVPATRRPLPIVALATSPWAPLAAVAAHQHVRLLNTDTRQPIGALAFPEGEPFVLRFSRDGRLLLAAGGKPVQAGKAVLLDVQTGKRRAEIGDEIDAVLAADLSPDQQLVALGGSGRVVKVYSTLDGSLKYKLTRHTDWITAIAFSPDGKRLATADRAGGIHLWDAASGGILLSLAEHTSAVRALAWRGDNRLLASGGEDGKLILWDANDGWPTSTMPSPHAPQRAPGTYGKLPSGVLSIEFAADGRFASSGRDRKVRLWDASGRALLAFDCAALPTKVAFAHDGRTLIAGDASGEVHFWPIAPGPAAKK